jgi:choline dehydrogenase
MKEYRTMRFHAIIVGAGSAGCVLAARLSEDPRRSVLLLEAGPDYPTEADLPPEIRSGLRSAYTHDWGYVNQPDVLGRSIELPRGKLVGGCSATNAGFAVRGTPSDYDEWAARGNPGWSFSELLPFFCRVESDANFHDGWHGQDGYLPIRRDAPETILPEHDAFLEACSALGYPRVADHNAPDAMGAGMLPRNVLAGVRQSAALTYLAAARSRSNLNIRSNILVDRVVFDGPRAVGVRLAGSAEIIQADYIVLAAGAFGSPAILMRSGLGPADHLKSLEIGVLGDLPGVGQNLIDHPLLELRFAAPASMGSKVTPGPQALLTLKSSDSRVGYDLHIFPWTIAPAESGASPTFSIYAALIKPLSHGRLRLSSNDPAVAPVIDSGYFTNLGDMPRMIHVVRVAEQLARTPPLSNIALHQIFPSPQTTGTSTELDAAIHAEIGTYYHPVGTCCMGPATDATAVVDSRGRVHGVQGLSVVDASIMPTIPAANTNLPTLMLAERCSAWLTEVL